MHKRGAFPIKFTKKKSLQANLKFFIYNINLSQPLQGFSTS
jgi:hypothetical protein